MHEYRLKRKLHGQGGSLLIALPKIWTRAEGLEEGDEVDVLFNGIVKVLPSANRKMVKTVGASHEK